VSHAAAVAGKATVRVPAKIRLVASKTASVWLFAAAPLHIDDVTSVGLIKDVL